MEVTVVYQPKQSLLIKRGKVAEDYFTYVGEVGCDVWDELLAMAKDGDEPVALWLPDELIPEGTSRYVLGVVVSEDRREIPEGYEQLDLPPATYLKFQGTPYDDARFEEAILELRTKMDHFDPTDMNYVWDDTVPRVQWEPCGERGYIEMRGVKPRNYL